MISRLSISSDSRIDLCGRKHTLGAVGRKSGGVSIYETLSVPNMVSPSSKSIVLEARLTDHSARFESTFEEGIAYALGGSTCRTLQTRSRYNVSVNK